MTTFVRADRLGKAWLALVGAMAIAVVVLALYGVSDSYLRIYDLLMRVIAMMASPMMVNLVPRPSPGRGEGFSSF